MMDTKQMYSFIKMRGFTHYTDVLGTYYNKGQHRLTINKQAQWYNCFYNVNDGFAWQLVSKSQTFDNFPAALNWVVKEIENHKL